MSNMNLQTSETRLHQDSEAISEHDLYGLYGSLPHSPHGSPGVRLSPWNPAAQEGYQNVPSSLGSGWKDSSQVKDRAQSWVSSQGNNSDNEATAINAGSREGYGAVQTSPKHSSQQINAILTRKLADKQQNIVILEIKQNGDSCYKEMSIRDLLLYIEKETDIIEQEAVRQSPSFGSEGVSGVGMQSGAMSGLFTQHSGKAHSSSSMELLESGGPNKRRQSLASHAGSSKASHNTSTKVHIQGINNIKNRDLRRLEYQFNPLGDPVILVRRHVVLVSFDPVRAIVMSDRILMIVPDGADSLLQLFHNNMSDWAESSGVSFEVRAYEAIFTTVISIHNQDCIELQHTVDSVLSEFKRASIIPIERQEQMRILKNRVSGQLAMIMAYRRTIEELLEDDGDLALLNLSVLKPKPYLYDLPLSQEILCYHEEMEIIMESYIMDYNSLQSKLEYLKSQMQSAEELVMLRLDTSRNQLLIADTVISVVACCLAMGSFVGSVYGMNLKNHMEEDPHMFSVVLWLTVFGIIILGLSTIGYFKLTGVLPSESKPLKLFEGDQYYDKISEFL